ncbi:MAG: polysaccharide pyruvyl transferase CsaB [Synechococcus sp.]
MALKETAQTGDVLVCGYYGEHNLGDDALLDVLLTQLPPSWTALVTAHDGAAVQAAHPHVETVQRRALLTTIRALMRAEVLVLGGGSLLQDSTSLQSLMYYLCLIVLARFTGKPVVLWGQGLGPLHRPLSRVLVRLILPWVQAIGWRDPESQALADRWRLRVPGLMAADPVWSYPGTAWRGGHCPPDQRSGLVLCWRPTDHLDADGWSDLLHAVESLAVDQGLPVTWLAFHQHQDQSLPRRLQSQGLLSAGLLQQSRFLLADSLPQVMDVLSRAQLVLPMRLHALILAQLAGAPCCALSYDPKVRAAAAMAGVDCVELEALPSRQSILDRWTRQLWQPPDRNRIQTIQDDAARHRLILHKVLLNKRRSTHAVTL